jgi:hypothetical protein
MSRLARCPGEIEFSDQRGPARVEQMLRTDGESVPREVRARVESRIREYRNRPATPDLNTTSGRIEHTERLLAEIQAEQIMRSN